MAKRILVIDDDEDILDIMNVILQEEGYEVIISNTSETADHIHLIQPDLILLDINLHGSAKKGNEICADIKAIYTSENIPVILVSAEPDIKIIAHECAADTYVSKPFDIHILLEQVKRFIMVP